MAAHICYFFGNATCDVAAPPAALQRRGLPLLSGLSAQARPERAAERATGADAPVDRRRPILNLPAAHTPWLRPPRRCDRHYRKYDYCYKTRAYCRGAFPQKSIIA
eukprot:6191721-Pleurochrysis_carterae.AAC.1